MSRIQSASLVQAGPGESASLGPKNPRICWLGPGGPGGPRLELSPREEILRETPDSHSPDLTRLNRLSHLSHLDQPACLLGFSHLVAWTRAWTSLDQRLDHGADRRSRGRVGPGPAWSGGRDHDARANRCSFLALHLGPGVARDVHRLQEGGAVRVQALQRVPTRSWVIAPRFSGAHHVECSIGAHPAQPQAQLLGVQRMPIAVRMAML